MSYTMLQKSQLILAFFDSIEVSKLFMTNIFYFKIEGQT